MTRQWLKQFLRYLAYTVKMLQIWFIYLSCPLKAFFPIFSTGSHFVQQSRTILSILAKGHKRNIDVKSFEILPLATEMSFKGFSILALVTILFSIAEPFLAILVKGDKRSIFVKSF